MARIKAICSNCGKTTLLKISSREEDYEKILALGNGEVFEDECPRCGRVAPLTVVE